MTFLASLASSGGDAKDVLRQTWHQPRRLIQNHNLWSGRTAVRPYSVADLPENCCQLGIILAVQE
ncbi:MAG: hypothetical protein PUP91_07605 [Rhizonema sp. PD37]|nr:hypothetical protein [Rhizonema sp. PD37]